jgi:hypothetical protein
MEVMVTVLAPLVTVVVLVTVDPPLVTVDVLVTVSPEPPQALARAIEPTAAPPTTKPASLRNSLREIWALRPFSSSIFYSFLN